MEDYTDQEYYDLVCDIVERQLDFDTVISDKYAGKTPEQSAEEFISEYGD